MKKEKDKASLRSYPAPWKGELVLVCSKCTKKLKHKQGALNVRKWLRTRRNKDENAPQLRVIGVNCVKMCPKGGITVATQHQLGQTPPEVSIIRSSADLEALYQQLSA